MHGRVKIKTSEEMQAIRRKEEEEKAKVFESKMKELLRKKHCGEFDNELEILTSDIIHMNPDVLTAWNARKESLENLKMRGIEITPEQVESELKLTKVGLRINPKSYSSWHHRCWTLDNFADESAWSRELELCSEYLKLDDRNFLCWDYRRYVVEKHGVDVEKELEFSMEKLAVNFSNYSAWHYRSKLIPRLHPEFKEKNVCSSDVYQNEISLVENAVYTDPNDQSAWFYHRWLLGLNSHDARIMQAGYCQKFGKAWVSIYPANSSLEVKGLDGPPWRYLNENGNLNILVKDVKEVFSSNISLYENGEVIDSINDCNFTRPAKFSPSLSNDDEKKLKAQLDSYEKLLKLEPNNKWSLLATLMIKEKLGENIDISSAEKLITIDKYRGNYYSNMICRYKIEAILKGVTNWFGSIDLSGRNLNAFYHSYFFTHFQLIDLSNNPFGNDIIPKLAGLFSCHTMNLSNCKITSIEKFPSLPNLCSLNISKNQIKLEAFPVELFHSSLKFLDCSETQITSNVLEETKTNWQVEIKY